MTRTRKLTLSVKEFSHLVSESLQDIAHASPSPQSFVNNTAFFSEMSPQKTHHRPSSFHRIFSRPPPAPSQREDSPEAISEDAFETPRKMIAWPFSRSPRKNRAIEVEDNATSIDVRDGDICHSSPCSITSLAAASTSSLGSLVPSHERLFQVTSRASATPSQDSSLPRAVASSSGGTAPPQADELPTSSGRYAFAIPAEAIFGNGSVLSVCASSNHSIVEPNSSIWSGTRTTSEGTSTSRSVANSESESVDEDPTPRASTFGPRATLPLTPSSSDPLLVQRDHLQGLSLAVLSRSMDVLASRPVLGVALHLPSESECSVSSACLTSPPTSPVEQDSSPSLPEVRPLDSGASSPRVSPSTPPNQRILAAFPDVPSPSNFESAAPISGFSPRQRKRAMSGSMTPPPLPRPPPTGPLPAVPSPVLPVPPLPSHPNKISTNMTTHSVISSPPRSTLPGVSTNPTTALPPSPPGALRLPSRLSWVNGVRAVLPSPPASPTKPPKSLNGKTSLPISPSKVEKKRAHELKRLTSIGVIEAADNVQVRRTKSILLLGSRSKSSASLGPKRVQIHADANVNTEPSSRKARRKSSADTMGHPVLLANSGPGVITPMPSSELLVPRERRHSAPLLLSNSDANASGASADWTLSLPFCTDVPGNKIPPSPSQTPKRELEEVEDEDWTLCMPLKFRADTPTIEASEGGESESTSTEMSGEVVESRDITQLPTPSPSPTLSTPPFVVRPSDPQKEDMHDPVDRPATPASLGPHVGGLDLAGGCGKRASGWHVYGWFDEVRTPVASTGSAVAPSGGKSVKSHIAAFRKTHDASGRQSSQESMSTVSTSETVFYSARSSLLVN